MSYDPGAIEPKWQRRWRELGIFESRVDPGRPKYYCYNPAPYVTGTLHMGHVRNYACGDFVAKYKLLGGSAVLYTIGFDAFGLPTETAAIRNATEPERWTADCLREMRRQLDSLGCGFDWRRSFVTSDPAYYKWTQWIFLQLHERKLVYSAVGRAQWCPRCETSLARTQVVDGRCWICEAPVEERSIREWRLRLSPWLPDLLSGLQQMRDLNGLAKQGQEVLIGPRSGLRVDLLLAGSGRALAAFLKRRNDWRSDCVVLVAPGDAGALPPSPERAAGPVDSSLAARVKTLFPEAVFSGVDATEESSGRTLAVFVGSAGEAAIAEWPVIVPLPVDPDAPPPDQQVVPEFPPVTVYSQRDFSISRQRAWGTPIPMVLCEACGEVPVAVEDLPVLAPKVVLDGDARRLIRQPADWDRRPCPRCGAPGRLEPQVMDCHMDSIWHPFRPCAREGTDFLFDPEEMRYWMPADIIQFGRDVIPFMLDLRFFSHFLHSLGHVPFREFCRDVLAHGLVLHEGRKMSKHLGNVVQPDEVIRRFGADSLRFYILAHAEPRSDFRWSDEGIARYHEILSRHHALVLRHAAERSPSGETSAEEDQGDETARAGAPGILAPADAAGEPGRTEDARLSRYTNVFLKKAAREVATLESGVDTGRYDRYAGALARLLSAMDFYSENHLAKEAYSDFPRIWQARVRESVVYLAPIAPHLAEECWELLGHRESVFARPRFTGGPRAKEEARPQGGEAG